MNLRVAGALAGALLFLHPAHAAESLPEAIRACAALKRDPERLACYDRAVANIESGAEAPASTTPENMFGANSAVVAKPKAPPQAPEPEELRQITGKIVSVNRAENGLVELALDNNQVWRQQDSETTLTIQSGDSVTISRASLGTFRITDKRGRSARFKRVR